MEGEETFPQTENEITQFVENNQHIIAQAFAYLSTQTLDNAQEEERRIFLSRFSSAIATLKTTLPWLNRTTEDEYVVQPRTPIATLSIRQAQRQGRVSTIAATAATTLGSVAESVWDVAGVGARVLGRRWGRAGVLGMLLGMLLGLRPSA